MNKPRLCEIFGVDVNEEFRFKGINSVWCYINEKGLLFSGETYNDEALIDVLLEAINEPEKYIIHKRKWTSEEFKNAKAIKQLFPLADTVAKTIGDKTGIVYTHVTGYNQSRTVYETKYTTLTDYFPSLKVGEEAMLNDIIESEVASNVG